MIKKIFLSVLVLTIAYISHAQKLIGSWQLTEEKTCFQSRALERREFFRKARKKAQV